MFRRPRLTASSRTVAVVLTMLLLSGSPPVIPAQDRPVSGLQIVVIEGAGAINNLEERRAREPVVMVVDSNERPVAGATVTFTLPSMGASARFPDGSASLTTTTDSDGRAVGRGLRPNNVVGQFEIRVAAAYQGRTATTTLTQINAAPAEARKGSRAALWILLLAGAAGGVGAAVAMGGGGSGAPGGSPSPPVGSGATITPGVPIIGPPPQ
jgi:hypothetical protein